jgi:hypothetical protein
MISTRNIPVGRSGCTRRGQKDGLSRCGQKDTVAEFVSQLPDKQLLTRRKALLIDKAPIALVKR